MHDNRDDFIELIGRAKHGDQAAMATLVERYEPELVIFARVHLGTLLRPYLDSVDLVQSVHRSILIGLRDQRFEISTPEKLIGLAFTMVRRKIARQWRRHRRQTRVDRSYGDDDLSQIISNLADTQTDPALVASRNDSIKQVVDSCTRADRRLLMLRIDGFSTAEAARLLGLDPDISRVRLSRLRSRLRMLGVASELV